MGKLSDAVRAAAHPSGPRCTVAILRDQMSEEDRSDFDELIRDESVPCTTIMQQVGLMYPSPVLGRKPVQRHRCTMLGRDGGCSCPV